MNSASLITATRYHDISCGHRVAGHESKCAHLHGHNYRIHFTCAAQNLDVVGRVLDFSVMKAKLCMWLEEKWDHQFLAWEDDAEMRALHECARERKDRIHMTPGLLVEVLDSIVWVPFNPTAENIADHLLRVVGPKQLRDTGVYLTKVVVEETMKCRAEASL